MSRASMRYTSRSVGASGTSAGTPSTTVASTGTRTSQRCASSPSIGASSSAVTSSGWLAATSLTSPRTSSGMRPRYPLLVRASALDRVSHASVGRVADRAYRSSGVQISSTIGSAPGDADRTGDRDQPAEIQARLTASERRFDAPFEQDQRLDRISRALLAANIHDDGGGPGLEQLARRFDGSWASAAGEAEGATLVVEGGGWGDVPGAAGVSAAPAAGDGVASPLRAAGAAVQAATRTATNPSVARRDRRVAAGRDIDPMWPMMRGTSTWRHPSMKVSLTTDRLDRLRHEDGEPAEGRLVGQPEPGS